MDFRARRSAVHLQVQAAMWGMPMKAVLVAVLCCVAATAFADDVTFACELQGHSSSNGVDGFEITAVNTSHQVKKCDVTCNVTLGDGSTKDFPYYDQHAVRCRGIGGQWSPTIQPEDHPHLVQDSGMTKDHLAVSRTARKRA